MTQLSYTEAHSRNWIQLLPTLYGIACVTGDVTLCRISISTIYVCEFVLSS